MPRPLKAVWDVLASTFDGGMRHELGLFAPAMAFSLVVSLAPLTLALNLLGPSIIASIEVVPGSPLAGADFSAESVYGSVIEAAGSLAPAIVLLLVLWGASALFAQVGQAIVRIWEQGETGGVREFVRGHLVAVGLLVVAAFALFASAVVGNALANVGGFVLQLQGRLGLDLGWVDAVLSSRLAVDFVFSAVLFGLAFTVVPRIRPRVRDVAPGVLITAAAYAVGQALLAYYLASSPRFGALGAYGAMLAFLIWALYTSSIVLWGAELTHEIARRRACARGGADTEAYECA